MRFALTKEAGSAKVSCGSKGESELRVLTNVIFSFERGARRRSLGHLG